MNRYGRKGKLMLTVNFQSRTPVYRQLYDDVIRLVALNIIKSDSKLPAVRNVAAELGINPNTVQKAYKMLESDGYIYSVVGKGSFVSKRLCMDEAERITARHGLQIALGNAYKKGVTSEEVYTMVADTFQGGIQS